MSNAAESDQMPFSQYISAMFKGPILTTQSQVEGYYNVSLNQKCKQKKKKHCHTFQKFKQKPQPAVAEHMLLSVRKHLYNCLKW